MPITYADARRATQYGQLLKNQSYATATVKSMIIERFSCTTVEANRIVARVFDCRTLQAAIRSPTPPGIVRPRFPLLASNPQATHADLVTIVATVVRTQTGLADKTLSVAMDGLAGDTWARFEAKLDARIAQWQIKYPAASFTVTDLCRYIY